MSKSIYEIDETLVKRAWHDYGSNTTYLQWILGILNRNTGRVIVRLVKDRTASTLEHNIKKYVPKGSIICTDELSSYNNLYQLGYQHFKNNHKLRDYSHEDYTETKEKIVVTINHLESYWHEYKAHIKNHAQRNVENLELEAYRLEFAHSGINFFDIFHVDFKYQINNNSTLLPPVEVHSERAKESENLCVDVTI